ncbi:MAG: MFS transporter [Roseiarcus sp.]
MNDGLENPRRALAFAALAIAVAMTVIDSAIVNVALPTIAADLAVTPERSIWVVNAYQLAITVSLLPLASLGDILGYKRVWMTGLAMFTLASLACGLSPSLTLLTAARLVQGLGAAGIMSVNIAFVRAIYPKSRLGAGVGNVALVVATSAASSPTLAAAILAVAPWQWLFFVNVPIGAVAILVGLRTLPMTPQVDGNLDPISVVLNVVTFGLLIGGIDALGDKSTTYAAMELAGAAAAGALLTWRQFWLELPVLPIDLLRLPVFALSMGSSVTSFCAYSLAFVALPFHFQGVLHYSPTQTGLVMTPWPLATALIAPISGRLADRLPPGLLGTAGLLTMAVGLISTATMPDNPEAWQIAWRLALCGLGFGFFQAPNNKIIISSAPPGRSGGASGLQSTGRLVGQSMGAAAMAVIFARGASQPMATACIMAAALVLFGALTSGLRRAR